MEYELIAAVDMGSNSFRLQVARVVGDQIYPLDSLKESVRLAAGLLPDKTLDVASQARGIAALRQFGERLRGFDPLAVRAVATNTLRVARNASQFLAAAEAALGFPIDVIAGREEARLIYIGVAHSLPMTSERRLVVDIGGGSTEFIIGRAVEPILTESLYMGCVSYSMRYFPGGKVDAARFREAEIAAARELENIAHEYFGMGWDVAVGSSGTAREIEEIIDQNGFNPGRSGGITRSGLDRLKTALINAGSAERLALTGMRSDRIPVLPGGLAILSAVFELFELEHMTYGDGALRLGVLYDLLGRFHHHDMRDATVEQFMRRYQVDFAQAARVEVMALDIFRQLWTDPGHDRDEAMHFLTWAARLHEIGISVAHSGYHKHGAYILTFADMPGFSKKDQGRLAFLVLGHRGKLEKISSMARDERDWGLVVSLRLAALLARSRLRDSPPVSVKVRRSAKGFRVGLPPGWLKKNAMTRCALDEEVCEWRSVGFVFDTETD